MRLTGKNAIVTGAAHGLGKEIAIGYAREGADVAVVDIDAEGAEETAKLIRELGRNAVAFMADVSEEQVVSDVVKQILEVFGKIDILVNGTNMPEDTAFEDVTPEHWDKIMKNNLTSVFLCTKAVAAVMKEQGGGKIVNLTSTAAERGRVHQNVFCAAKACIETFTTSAALQLGQYNIYVNAIAPGVMLTENPEKITDDEELMQYRIHRLPFKRLGRPDEIVGPAVFLACDESSYMTGQTIFVDGGLTSRLDSCGGDE